VTILITGGAGFIGSHFVRQMCETYPNDRFVILDVMTYAASIDYLAPVQSQITLVRGDISDTELVGRVFSEWDVRRVVHFAAESHVDNSVSDPSLFVRTNVVGTQTLLEAARHRWMESPFVCRAGYESSRFVHVSTDEVFGTLGNEGVFNEDTPYAPNSPYSATKAGADFLVRSYFHTFGLPVVTTNCSNNYGPHQHDEKLIPTIIRSALNEHPIPIYGTGENIRDWLFVGDHCSGIHRVLTDGRLGQTYLIGTRNEWNNITIAQTICQILDIYRPRVDGKKYDELITFVSDRPGHDLRYAIDPSKIETELGWRPVTSFADGLRTTVEWYTDKYLYVTRS